jgi:NAD(P)-dependent dehydrogenase (short-subunit alcohol dehydrogenase family)
MAADLSGRAALITGAASGVGRASALAFASAGASAALVDIDAEGLADTAAAARVAGARIEVLMVDVTDLRAEIQHMRTQGAGAAVNTSSMLGAAMPDNGAYVAAKHGVHGLTSAAALELGGAGIRVNAIGPGATRTGMTSAVSDELLRTVPLGSIAEPEEIAAAAVWLCSPEASYITGSVPVADGGWLAG